jgi:glycosyltransferase involved in cell wall biosynthesis
MSFLITKLIILLLYIIYIFFDIVYSFNNSKIPKISIFLPIYNKEKYIKKSIKSIQSQTLKDIEIISINDCSNDTTLNILQEMAKNDSRIKIINNKKNSGLLYSRAIGIISCTGEYIMNLDPDDEFEGPDNLEVLYNYAKKINIDIISFGTLYKDKNKTIFKCTNFKKIYKQPKIFESTFNSKNNIIDFLIWNKLIKKDILLKAYKAFKQKVYGEKWNYHEDNIWSILVHKYAKSMKCLNKIIYIYNDFGDSLMKKRHDIIELNNLIYRHEMYKKIFTLKNEEKYLFAEINEIINFFKTHANYMKLLKKNEEVRNNYIKLFVDFEKHYHLDNSIKKKVFNFLNIIYNFSKESG